MYGWGCCIRHGTCAVRDVEHQASNICLTMIRLAMNMTDYIQVVLNYYQCLGCIIVKLCKAMVSLSSRCCQWAQCGFPPAHCRQPKIWESTSNNTRVHLIPGYNKTGLDWVSIGNCKTQGSFPFFGTKRFVLPSNWDVHQHGRPRSTASHGWCRWTGGFHGAEERTSSSADDVRFWECYSCN